MAILTLDAIEAERARRSLHAFVRRYWSVIQPEEFKDAWHIGATCEALEAVYKRQVRNLAISKPPGTSKSRILSIFFPAWVWLQDPSEKQLFASYNLDLLLEFAEKTVAVIKSERFQADYGNRVVLTGSALREFETTAKGFRFSTTAPRGPVTGKHGTLRIIDDPLKPDEVDGAGLEAVNTWHGQTWATRVSDANREVNVVSMQRLSDNDLVSKVLGEGYEYLAIQMRKTNAFSYPSWLRIQDPRTEDGALLDPDRFPEAYVAKLEKGLGPMDAAAQLQQDPVPAGGAIIKEAWLQYEWSGVREDLPRQGTWLHSWDCAFKDESSSDYVVGQVWFIAWPMCYLVHQYREKADFVATCAAVKATADMYPSDRILIEDKANGPAVINALARLVSGIEPINPDGGKVARANAVSGIYAAGQVLLPAGAEWLADYRHELSRFPRARKDDQVDASTQALNWAKGHYTDLAGLGQGLRDPAMLRALLGL